MVNYQVHRRHPAGHFEDFQVRSENPVQMIFIEAELIEISRPGVKIEVLRGIAWISLDNEDVFLQPGESYQITRANHPLLISRLSLKEPLVIRMHEAL